ncbi:MAG TPA: hypothetical protein VKB59_22500 [Micromonosporaceae bacterium]|nr:hypothetical protein [Micromonosporaceae bacterium]
MTAVIVDRPPFVLIKPKLVIGTDPNTIEFECGANELDIAPDQDSNDVETFCSVFTTYKPEKWTITITILQSFGTDGLWNNLRPLANTIVDFLVIPDESQPISETNVAISGKAYMPGFAYIQAAVGEASESDLVLAVQGDPEFLVAPPA